MDAIREVDIDLSVYHLVHRRWAKMLAGVAVLLHTAMVANIRIADDQVDRLIVLVASALVVDVGQLVKGEFSIALRRAQGRFAAVGRAADCIQLAHIEISGVIA